MRAGNSDKDVYGCMQSFIENRDGREYHYYLRFHLINVLNFRA